MKKIKIVSFFVSALFFGNLSFTLEGIAVIDYNRVFLGTDLARERVSDLSESSDYKDLKDEAQQKNNERLELVEKLNKEESTLSDSEKEDIIKKAQTLFQSIQLLSQQIQAKDQEVIQKLEADQVELARKVIEELIKAKKIRLLFNSQALLSYDRSDDKIDITPEVIELLNKEQKK